MKWFALIVFVASSWLVANNAAAADPADAKPAEEKPAVDAKASDEKPADGPVEVRIDTTQAPELSDFAAKAKEAVEKWYPKISEELKSEGYTPPKVVTIIFRPSRGVAGTSGTKVVCSARYFKSHPDDVGAIVHEAVHVVQHYPKYDPVWLVEGIADYVRWFEYEPAKKRPHPDPERAKYNDSYQTSAAFLAWAQEKYDKHLVVELNAALREGTYTSELWEKLTGKPLETLGDEFREHLRSEQENKK